MFSTVIVYLIDGTYELFRYFFSPAAAYERSAPEELRAVRGVVTSLLGMLEGGATHLGVATDHVIESFRNTLWPGYKTGEGIDPLLRGQFQPLEEALTALGVVVWPMVEFEADDALAAAAVMAAADPRVDQVVVCTPDKDLAQCVRGGRIVQLDRRTRELRDESGVRQKFGVPPQARVAVCGIADQADPQARSGVGRARARFASPGHDARRATRAGAAVSEAGHLAVGCADRRRCERPAVGSAPR
jgi:5'-3' exonuclease